MEIKPKKVADYLRDVDYSDMNDYMPSDFALSMANIIKAIEGGSPENKTPVMHLRMLDNFVAPGLDTINMCHRGAAKSTLKEYLIWYIALFNELPVIGSVPYAIYVSDSADNGIKRMRKSLENRYNSSEFLRQCIPVCNITDQRWEFTNKDGKTLVVTGHGAKQAIRGTRENGSRPVLALLDDLLSDDDARSPTVIKSIEENVHRAIEFALHPTNRKVIWSGTPFHAGDPLYKAIESGAWAVNVYPVCEKFPCEPEEFKGSWEERFTYESINKKYQKLLAQGEVSSFYQELMLQIMSDDERLIQDSDIQWYNHTSLIKHKPKFNFYITTDFATSIKKSADYSVISVWAYNNVGNIYWVDGICKRQDMNQNMNDLFRLVQQWNPISVGIEVTGQQGGFIPWIQNEMMDRNVYFSLASDNNSGNAGIRPVTDKIARLNTMVPMFKQHKIYLPNEKKTDPCMVQAIDELSHVCAAGFRSAHDDWSDTLSMLSVMPMWKPSQASNGKVDDSGIWGMWEPELEYTGTESYIV